MKTSVFSLLTLPVVAECSSVTSTEDALSSHGYSETYVAGYDAGCASGKHAGGDMFGKRSQDGAAYAANADYKTGWDYGFITCKQKEVRDLEIATAIGIGLAAGSSNRHGAYGIDARAALAGLDTSAIQAAGW
ncbi:MULTISPECIES: hypothetical protein [Falsihalocynthiibacter]|uniref:hypothetical protein n=1 Tax=Falsihalocynthiibacter TaxID=2854182 RepID=UPI00300220D3